MFVDQNKTRTFSVRTEKRTNSGAARRLGSQLLGGWQHKLIQQLLWRADSVHLGLMPERHTANNLRQNRVMTFIGSSACHMHR